MPSLKRTTSNMASLHCFAMTALHPSTSSLRAAGYRGGIRCSPALSPTPFARRGLESFARVDPLKAFPVDHLSWPCSASATQIGQPTPTLLKGLIHEQAVY